MSHEFSKPFFLARSASVFFNKMFQSSSIRNSLRNCLNSSFRIQLYLKFHVIYLNKLITSTRFCGIYVDESLAWESLSKFIPKKREKGIGIIGRVHKYVSKDTFVLLLSILKRTVPRKSMWTLNVHFSKNVTMVPFIWL